MLSTELADLALEEFLFLPVVCFYLTISISGYSSTQNRMALRLATSLRYSTRYRVNILAALDTIPRRRFCGKSVKEAHRKNDMICSELIPSGQNV